jgi:hypothetical protein
VSPLVLANKQQWCGIAGWTARQFDAAVADGFPASKKTSSRGDNWQVDTRDGIQWVVEQEAPKYRPKPRQVDRGEPPPGWEAFKSVELVEEPFAGIGMITALAIMYALPRLAANVCGDNGVDIERTWRISGAMLVTVWTFCQQKLDYWPKAEDAVELLDAAFLSINWPHLAVKSGRPDWRPPSYTTGWPEVTPEEFAVAVAHGEALDAECRRLEEQDVAARADA